MIKFNHTSDQQSFVNVSSHGEPFVKPSPVFPSTWRGRSDPGGYVYLFKSSLGPYKIGLTKNVARRITDFATLPFDVFCVCVIETNNMREVEGTLHKRFASKRIKGEWFNLTRKDVFYIQCMALESGVVYVYRTL